LRGCSAASRDFMDGQWVGRSMAAHRVGLLLGALLNVLLCGYGSPAVCNAADNSRRQAWPFERSSDGLVVHANYDASMHDGLIESLQVLRGQMQEQLGVEMQSTQIHLVLFDDQASFEEYLSYYFPNVPHRRALFIRRRGPGMIYAYDQAELAVDLRHEMVHALVNATMPRVPLWLDEGLAEYYEVESSLREQDHPHRPWVKRGAAKGPDVSDLEQLSSLEQMGPREYEAAWAWVHFMLHGKAEVKEVFRSYLDDLQLPKRAEPLSQRLFEQNREYRKAFNGHHQR
jgi:hypothetical protein